MILDTTSKTLEIVLGAAKTTNDCEFTADYVDTQNGSTFAPAGSIGLSNGTSAVTAVSSPAVSTQRAVRAFTFYNADTVNTAVSVRIYDGTNRRRLLVVTLSPGQSLVFTPEGGWSIINSALQTIANASDYSKGTWTPADNSGAGLSFSAINCQYTKLANMVFAYGTLLFPSTASSANTNISGLPYPVVTISNMFFPAGAVGATNVYNALAINGTSTFEFFNIPGNAPATNAQCSSSRLEFVLIYSTT